MKESIPTGPSAEELRNREDEARLQDFRASHPEMFMEEQIDGNLELATAEALFADFESNFDLEALRAIVTWEEARSSKLREAAKEALIPLAKVVRPLIEGESGLSPEARAALKARWKEVSNAVGFIVSASGWLRHD